MGLDSAVGMETVRGSNPGGGASTMPTGSFPGVKRPGRGVDHPPTSSAEAKEIVELYCTPLWAFVACHRVNFTFTFTFRCLMR
jgi:hypothetical protein